VAKSVSTDEAVLVGLRKAIQAVPAPTVMTGPGGIFVGVDGYGADAQLVRGAEDADGDLAAVGDEELADGFLRLFRRGLPSSRWSIRGGPARREL
jgi:hypothetical protein